MASKIFDLVRRPFTARAKFMMEAGSTWRISEDKIERRGIKAAERGKCLQENNQE